MARWGTRTRAAARALVQYGAAVLTVVAALGMLRFSGLGPGLGGILFFAVLLSAWCGGLGPGLVSTGLIAAVAFGQFVRFVRTGAADPILVLVRIGLFTAGGVAISWLVEALHSARRRAESSATEAKQHEARLRQSEARVAAILENSPSVVYMKDTAGRYLMINRRFATLFDLDASAVIGKTDFDLFQAATADQFTANDLLVIERCRPIEFEEVVPQADGEHVYLSVKFPLLAADGSITAVCGKSIDITDRKRSEERRVRLGRQAALRADVSTALAMNETGLSAILGHCVQALVRHLDAVDAGIWTFDEPRASLVLQASAGDSSELGTALREVPLGSSLVGAVARDRAAHWTGCRDVPHRVERDGEWPSDGSVAVAGFPLIVGGRLLGVMAVSSSRPYEPDTLEALASLAEVIAQGIERKRLDLERVDLLARERVARTEAEAANQAKDRFLAVLSHELRTPLTPVLASVTALLHEPATTPEVRSVLELTQWAVKLESRLIDDLLDMTRITRGQLSLQLEPSDAHFLIQRAVEICRAEIDAGGITLAQDLGAVAHHVEADPARLEQVFWNLIKNAVKFSPGGGTITIRTRNGTRPASESEPAGAELIIEVTDTGIGIDAEVLPTIFDAFRQGEVGWVRRFGGLGLGLAISRSLVEAHRGAITAASGGKDQGATFTINLATIPTPAGIETDSLVPIPLPRALASSGTLKILLVEDDGPTLKVMTRLLGKAPYVVTAANTFAKALEAAAVEDFDLIISDIGLPDGSGLELMRQIRDRYAARGIALSGYGMEEDIRKSREAGFLAHLTKPVDFQKLQVAIAEVLS
jgi:PAS domain S-box-containing protein